MASDVKFIEIYRIYFSLSPFLNYYAQVSQKFPTIYSIVAAYSVWNVIGIPRESLFGRDSLSPRKRRIYSAILINRRRWRCQTAVDEER